jgi:hypothetical protein
VIDPDEEEELLGVAAEPELPLEQPARAHATTPAAITVNRCIVHS